MQRAAAGAGAGVSSVCFSPWPQLVNATRALIGPSMYFARMHEAQVLDRHISGFADVLGIPVKIPDRPPEGDPDYGLPRYVELPERGCAIVIDWEDVAMCVQFYGDGKDPKYRQYSGELPHCLTFNSSRESVRRALGRPIQYNDGGGLVPVLRTKMRPWDWFSFEGRKIHFEYRDGADGVLMVSVASLPSST